MRTADYRTSISAGRAVVPGSRQLDGLAIRSRSARLSQAARPSAFPKTLAQSRREHDRAVDGQPARVVDGKMVVMTQKNGVDLVDLLGSSAEPWSYGGYRPAWDSLSSWIERRISREA